MPRIAIHKDGQVHTGEVKENTNLVVRAGIKQFPYPHLKYKCGMGQCGTCTSRIIAGAEQLPARLCCQLWIKHDIELTQENLVPAAPPCTSS